MVAFIRRWWKWLLLLAIVAGILLFWNSRRVTAAASASVTTANATTTDFAKIISSSGKTKADKSVDLKFQTSGKLVWVGVTEGASVSAYQAIASMDVREVQKNLEKSLRDYSSTRNDFDEMTKVTYGSGAVPSYTMNDTIKRILEKNQWDLDKAVLDVELKSLALEYSRLSTPIAGIVTHVDTPVAGVNITPATAVFSVSDPSSMVFEANVDETEVGSLSVGQEATITLDAYPEATFSGTISYISYTSQLSSGGATVFPVKISFATPQSIRIGLNGDVSITTNRIPHALVIPIAAMREDKGKKYVYRKVGTKYERAYITVGPSSDTDIVVTGGLADGDTVVTKGFSVIPTPTP